MLENKPNDKPEEPESNGPKILDIETKMHQLYISQIHEPDLRETVTRNIEAYTKRLTNKIVENKDFLTIQTNEVNLKPLIRKWRGTFMKDEIKNYALNHLYASDTNMGKKDLERNLKLLNDNIELMGTTDGFERIERQIGFSDTILHKSTTM